MPKLSRVAVSTAAGLSAIATVVLTTITPASAGTPGSPYSCAPVGNAIQGAHGDASVIGWESEGQPPVACLGGSFYARDNRNTTYGFGIYNESPTKWFNAEGYLPALVTSFSANDAQVSITNFADKLIVDGKAYVAVYSRIRIQNPTSHAISISPDPSAGLLSLNTVSDTVPAGATVDHDYVIAVDRFGGTYDWPTDNDLTAMGGYDQHYAHMKSYWNGRLAQITQVVKLPDQKLADAYRTGFIYTQIIRDGDHLNVGANGYQQEYSHDMIGILANLFTQGDFSNAHALLERAGYVVGTQPNQTDGLWTLSWPWAIYLEKTGDLDFVRAHFATPGPLGPDQEPSIQATAHQIAADMTGPGGIMRSGVDPDVGPYGTVYDFSALIGLASYRYIAQQLGETSEAGWAADQYDRLLTAVNDTLNATTSQYHLDYLPCEINKPNSQTQCSNTRNANWAAPFMFGRWAWDAYLFGAPVNGPGSTLIDPTYARGFHLLRDTTPQDSFGGYGNRLWSTAYNAGYGEWALAGNQFRDQGIRSYQFMIDNAQSGPYSWWESSTAPASTPWIGVHPASGYGSSPHTWGIANANKVLLDSLLAQRSDGTLVVGRGAPTAWVTGGKPISIANFPTVGGNRIGATINGSRNEVTLQLTGHPAGDVRFQLPAFVNNIASSSSGSIDQASGTVTIPAATSTVTVRFKHQPSVTPRLTVDPAGSIVARPGQPTTVKGSFTNSGTAPLADIDLKLTAPSGWHVDAARPTTVRNLAPGSTFTGTWTLIAPSTSGAQVIGAVTVAADYTDDATGDRTSISEEQVQHPIITSVSPAIAAAGDLVTVSGANFGASQNGSFIRFVDNGTTWGFPNKDRAPFEIVSWSNDQLTFEVPTPSGTNGVWHVVPGTTATIQVTTDNGVATSSVQIGG